MRAGHIAYQFGRRGPPASLTSVVGHDFDPMKALVILIFLAFVLRAAAAPPPAHTIAVLPVAQYDLAELVFRQFISADAKSVFCLGYGTNYSPLPKEFIARFKAQNAIIRGEPDAITVVSNKIVLDKFTRREAIGLDIREIRVTGDTAEVQVQCFASSTGSSTRFYLVREKGKWRVQERKMEHVSDAF